MASAPSGRPVVARAALSVSSVFVLAACSGGSSSHGVTTTTRHRTTTQEVCRLVTRSEVDAALATTVGPGAADREATAPSETCLYSDAGGTTRARLFLRRGLAASFDTFRPLQTPPAQDVPGVGDRAFESAHFPGQPAGSGVTLFVTKGRDLLLVSVAMPGAVDAARLAAAKRLAADALKRL